MSKCCKPLVAAICTGISDSLADMNTEVSDAVPSEHMVRSISTHGTCIVRWRLLLVWRLLSGVPSAADRSVGLLLLLRLCVRLGVLGS